MRRRLVVSVFVLFALGLGATDSLGSTVIPGFRSPTGNIRCLLVPGRPDNLFCAVAHAGYAQALQDNCMARASLNCIA